MHLAITWASLNQPMSTVLVVEDSVPQREMITELLRGIGLTVTVADPASFASLLEDLAARARSDGVPARAGTEDSADLAALSSAELRTRARDLGLSGVGRLRKSELVELLSAPDFPVS